MKDKKNKIIISNTFIMKKYVVSTTFSKMQYVFSLLLVFYSSTLIAQDAQVYSQQDETLVVTFKTPFSYALDENVSWLIKNDMGVTIYKGKEDVSNLVFEIPGNYTLDIHDKRKHETAVCEHIHFPEKVTIKVLPVKLDFDINSIKFSKEIVGNQSADGITLNVNVNLESYDKSEVKYNKSLTSFGVGSTITGKVKNGEVTLTPGNNTLEFVLEGQAEAGNNIQLNFVDFNGEVQPYTLTPKVQ